MKIHPIFLNYIEGLPPIPTKIKKVKKEAISPSNDNPNAKSRRYRPTEHNNRTIDGELDMRIADNKKIV